MSILEFVLGLLIVSIVLWDGFETIVLPRSIRRSVRLARLVYRLSWNAWVAVAKLSRNSFREALLGAYGPLSLILLLAVWATGAIVGFGLIQKALDTHDLIVANGHDNLGAALYLSGTTFFTLGLGDVAPADTAARVFIVLEAGTGFVFLALVLSYLPIIYQAFSHREVSISLLDARAGSPPSALELLKRSRSSLSDDFFRQWEVWSAELLESHLSYPVLAYFRSQHEQQSWLAALTVVLDASALVMSGVRVPQSDQVRFTFAMSRHAIVDLAQVFFVEPSASGRDRLPEADFDILAAALDSASLGFDDAALSRVRLKELRASYEPVALALSERFLLPLPPWLPPGGEDDWQSSPWSDVVPLAGEMR